MNHRSRLICSYDSTDESSSLIEKDLPQAAWLVAKPERSCFFRPSHTFFCKDSQPRATNG